jgi:hypothetical protein
MPRTLAHVAKLTPRAPSSLLCLGRIGRFGLHCASFSGTPFRIRCRGLTCDPPAASVSAFASPFPFPSSCPFFFFFCLSFPVGIWISSAEESGDIFATAVGSMAALPFFPNDVEPDIVAEQAIWEIMVQFVPFTSWKSRRDLCYMYLGPCKTGPRCVSLRFVDHSARRCFRIWRSACCHCGAGVLIDK